MAPLAVPAAPAAFMLLLLVLVRAAAAWSPDSNAKLYVKYGEEPSEQFLGNATAKDFFKLLDKDNFSILVGARNMIYNLSLYDLTENIHQRIEWHSTRAHRELCALKGKSPEVDCQNYLRIAARAQDGKTLVCGTNAYKPLCRHYHPRPDGRLHKNEEFEGTGLCPYDPEHNSTAIYTNGQLYTATVADFSGTDPLIYRGLQRTERSDLRQLNNPSFVSSVSQGDYVFFFYRETAVEYMNCGKAMYSRVARVCLNDKGGPHQFGDRWTSFLKARLNCSIQGEYPFYFDEIQSTTDIVSGVYGSSEAQSEIIYGVLTTPVNSIGGSAVCAFAMRDIISAFNGGFKSQETINANWLPVEEDKIPVPRPGDCVKDSRTLPDQAVNFIKTHSLMEQAVPAFLSKPLLVRVSLQYRFTTIAVHPQVLAMNGAKYDVLYVGTDDGRVIKILNGASALGDFDSSADEDTRAPVETVIVSETQVLPDGVPVKQIHVALATDKLIVISSEIIRSMPLYHCNNISSCRHCVTLQDPHCAWDSKIQQCAYVGGRQFPNAERFLQDIEKGGSEICNKLPFPSKEDRQIKSPTHGTLGGTSKHPTQTELDKNNVDDMDNEVVIELVKSNEIPLMAEPKVKHETDSLTVNRAENMIYTAQSLHIAVVASCLVTLLIGFVVGYLFSRRFRHPFLSDTTPFHEQHNHLNRLTPLETPLNANPSAYLPPRANKTINLVVNVPAKQDNLQHELGGKDRSHECKNSNESLDKDIKCGTLQKVKKTYI